MQIPRLPPLGKLGSATARNDKSSGLDGTAKALPFPRIIRQMACSSSGHIAL